jgi:hypothetical protein
VKTTLIPVHLWILSLCASTGVNKFSSTVVEETVAVIHRTKFVLVSFIYLLSMDTITPINQFAAPSGIDLEPSESLKPIITPGYELRPSLISLV